MTCTYILERRTGAGSFSVVATLQDTGSYFDTTLQPQTNYTYRLKVQNYHGESAYAPPANVVTADVGLSLPVSGMRLWLDASSLPQVENAPVNIWQDRSGLGNHLQQTGVSMQPVVRLTAMNGLPAVRFNGTSTSMAFNPGTWPVGSGVGAAGEIFAVLKATSDNPGVNRGLWMVTNNYSSNPSYFPAADGTIRESFGTTNSYNLSDPARALNLSNVYNVTSRAGLWTANLNGVMLEAKLGTGVYLITNPTLGAYNNFYFAGDIAEIIAYDRMLLKYERDAVRNYLGWKYGEVDMHVDVDSDGDGLTMGQEIANGVDPNSTDSNGDGIWDGTSLASGFDPASDNPDFDGLTNEQEMLFGTDPFRADTDGDGYIDGLLWAELHDLYPLDPTRWAPPVGDTTAPTITLTNPPLGTL